MSYNKIDEEAPLSGESSGAVARTNVPWYQAYRTYLIVGGYVFLAAITTIIVVSASSDDSSSSSKPKNIIMMVSDGFGPASVTYGRTHSQRLGRTFTLDSILVGTSRTRSSSSLVTDSAAGATAFSCALKTYNYAIGVDENGKPCATVLEGAQKKGMKVGLVATSRITHATPASFSAHVANRNSEYDIALQQFEHNIDVMLGGGSIYFNATSRPDKQDLIQKSIDQGATFVTNLEELNEAKKTPLLGLFTEDHLPYDLDLLPTQPHLVNMTRKAIELLSANNEKGFFLMIEGSRIDHAGHGNDPVGHLSEILAYDETIAYVLDFAKKDGNTLVISVADHETGGLTLGRENPGSVYAWYPEVIEKVKHSTEWMSYEVIYGDKDAVAVFEENTMIDLTAAEEAEAIALAESVKNETTSIYIYQAWMGHKISEPAFIGWTTDLHTGVDVNLYSFGPSSEELRGNHENTDVGKLMEKYLGIDLAALTRDMNDGRVFYNAQPDNLNGVLHPHY